MVELTVFRESGERATTLFTGYAQNTGIYKLFWKPKNNASGHHHIIMKYRNSTQMRNIDLH